MRQIKQILVPFDYSPCAEDALRLAGTLARGTGARLLVLHLLPLPMYSYADLIVSLDRDWIASETTRLRSHVEGVLAVDGQPPAFEAEVQWGSAHLDIVQFAAERRSDLIVMGTHGRTGLKHVLLGSVAERTVRLAPCPVLTVRGGVHARTGVDASAVGAPAVRRGPVDRLAAPSPITVLPSDLLSTARDRMACEHVRHVAVVEGDGHLVGILSDRDLMRHVGHFDHTKVDAVMTKHPRTIAPDAATDTAARLMVDQRIRALPVVDGERLVGMLTATDILEDYVRAARRAA